MICQNSASTPKVARRILTGIAVANRRTPSASSRVTRKVTEVAPWSPPPKRFPRKA